MHCINYTCSLFQQTWGNLVNKWSYDYFYMVKKKKSLSGCIICSRTSEQAWDFLNHFIGVFTHPLRTTKTSSTVLSYIKISNFLHPITMSSFQYAIKLSSSPSCLDCPLLPRFLRTYSITSIQSTWKCFLDLWELP